MPNACCVGMDFGTDSVRTIIVDSADGNTIASSVFTYPRWKAGLFCNSSEYKFRQHPLDHIEGMEKTMLDCLQQAGDEVRKNIRAISVASTGSSPVMVDERGLPLSLHPPFENDPDAMILLWKDHSSIAEAALINQKAASFPVDYLRYCGGIYSSEWYWSKLLHILRNNKSLRQHGVSFVEHCDWIPFLLTGSDDISRIKRSVCAAGHKGLWAKEWHGFPPADFFERIDPLLSPYAKHMSALVYTADQPAGKIAAVWSEKWGLSPDIVVGTGAIDAHMGAVGGQIQPYYLSKVMGTSTCDMLVAPAAEMEGKFVAGICGLVNGSIIPGMIGMEAGQSAFGDVYAWFRDLLAWPLRQLLPPEQLEAQIDRIIPALTKQAAALPLTEQLELSLDWFNGRRTPDANPMKTAVISGLQLGSDAPKIFRSLVEATCFGARAIVERFIEQGVPVKGLIGIGGIARKSPFIMQMLADAIGMPIKVNRSEQTAALGAAMFAATVAGIYPDVLAAMQHMGQGFDADYTPDPARTAVYTRRYRQYLALGKSVA